MGLLDCAGWIIMKYLNFLIWISSGSRTLPKKPKETEEIDPAVSLVSNEN